MKTSHGLSVLSDLCLRSDLQTDQNYYLEVADVTPGLSASQLLAPARILLEFVPVDSEGCITSSSTAGAGGAAASKKKKPEPGKKP